MRDSEKIALTIDQAKEKIAKAEKLERLSKNPDFKELILDDYLKNHVVSLIMRKAAPGFQKKEDQDYIDNQITGMGYFNQYMLYVGMEGAQAKASLYNHEAELEEALEEEN